MILAIPIGISGVGKTYLGKQLEKKSNNFKIVSIYELRKQFEEKDVFDAAYDRTIQLLKNGYSVYFDYSNLNKRDKLYEKVKDIPNLKVVIFYFLRSYRPDFAKIWVRGDLSSGKDRENTTKKIDGKCIIDNQFETFRTIFIKDLKEELSQFERSELKYIEGNYVNL